MIEEALKAEARDDMGGPSIINHSQVVSYPNAALKDKNSPEGNKENKGITDLGKTHQCWLVHQRRSLLTNT